MVSLYARRSEVQHWETILPAQTGVDRIETLVTLAWYERQNQTVRAREWALEAEGLIGGLPADDPRRTWVPRVDISRAEHAWLLGHLDEAARFTDQAQAGFEALGDNAGLGDVLWMRTSLLFDQGDRAGSDSCLVQAVDHYQDSWDARRTATAQARQLMNLAFQHPDRAAAEADRIFGAQDFSDTEVAPWLTVVRGVVSAMTGDLGPAIRTYSQAVRESLEYGILRLALVSAGNVSGTYSRLGAMEESLEWAERAAGMAGGTGSPGLIGITRSMLAECLRSLGRFDDARKFLGEALEILATEPGSRNYTNIFYINGDIALAEGRWEEALGWFRKLEDRAEALDAVDFRLSALAGLATALAHLGRGSEARDFAAQALEKARAQQDTEMEVRILRLMAGFHPAEEVRYLREALGAARANKAYLVPPDLLGDLAKALAASGDYQGAYGRALEAEAARQKARLLEVQNRAVAMQVKHETDQIRAEAERQRQLAAGERMRAETLQQANASLETLGRIGREITATLKVQGVCEALYRHVHELLELTTFLVFRLDDRGEALHGLFGIESGRPVTLPVFRLDDEASYLARCARDRAEILLDIDPQVGGPGPIPGTRQTLSLLYAPLVNADRLLGVISIQSDRPGAYGDRERSIFQAICAYGAIALANAVNYAQVEAAHALIQKNQDQLIASEKMASLGRLTAGIAHEMNTPIAAVRAALEGLGRLAAEVNLSAGDPEVNSQDYQEIAAEMQELVTLAKNSSERAASFIRSIKTQTREGGAESKILFDLVSATDDALTLLDFAVRPKGVTVRRAGDPGPVTVLGNPARYAQVVTNLVNNAIDAVPAQGGTIVVTVTRGPRGPEVTVADNGSGIPPEVLPRIFDPLFTTKRFGEGTGLGLTIVRDIVTGDFGGTIDVQSGPDRGTAFVLGFGG